MKEKKKKLVHKSEKKSKLRILAIGDLHGDSRQASKLAEKALKEKVDLVILSGDITQGESSLDYLVGPFAKRKIEVLLIPGNHETLSAVNFLEKAYSPYVKNIHGLGLKKKNVGIFAAGGANIGLFQWNEKEVYDTLKKGFDKIKDSKKKIMVTHVHPSHSLMEKLTSFFEGSEGIERAIKKFQPDLAICSHVHEAEGMEEKIGKTKLINVGKGGKIIEI